MSSNPRQELQPVVIDPAIKLDVFFTQVVGFAVGTGDTVGDADGFGVGIGVGFGVGIGVGLRVGFSVGLTVGVKVGFLVGAEVINGKISSHSKSVSLSKNPMRTVAS